MHPLSNDLRERILKAIDNHEGSRRNLAARFCVNPSTVTRLLQPRRQTGSFDPRPHRGGVGPTLDHDALERLRALVEQTPDATLEDLRQRMGISGSVMIICRPCRGSACRGRRSPDAPPSGTRPRSGVSAARSAARSCRSSRDGWSSWTRPGSPRR